MSPPCDVTIRVRYPEVDRMDRVHHSHYFRYFEVGRTEYLRRRGLTYRELEESGLLLPLASVNARFRRGAAYDQVLTVRTTLETARGARVVFSYAVLAEDGTVLCTGESEHGLVDPAGRPRRLPADLLERLQTPETGAADPVIA